MFKNNTNVDPFNSLLLSFFPSPNNLEVEIKNKSSVIKRSISLHRYIRAAWRARRPKQPTYFVVGKTNHAQGLLERTLEALAACQERQFFQTLRLCFDELSFSFIITCLHQQMLYHLRSFARISNEESNTKITNRDTQSTHR
jgi:hypothetical protein